MAAFPSAKACFIATTGRAIYADNSVAASARRITGQDASDKQRKSGYLKPRLLAETELHPPAAL